VPAAAHATASWRRERGKREVGSRHGGRWSAARERMRRSAVAEASGGAGALALEWRRRRRATSGAVAEAARRERPAAGQKDRDLWRGRTGTVGPTDWDAK
jgi:hypothetical protein